jgi:hypothetical protein
LGPVDHVDVAIDDDRFAVRNMGQRSLDSGCDPDTPHLTHCDDEIAGGKRVLVHLAAVGEAGESDLRDILA